MEIIRDRDQADFRGGRSDFGSRMGSTIDVRSQTSLALTKIQSGQKPSVALVLFQMLYYCICSVHTGGRAQVRGGHRHWQKR